MDKEYYFIIKTKNGATLTYWDLAKDDKEAEQKQLRLHNHLNALTSWNDSPSNYQCHLAFLNVMRSHGFNGYVKMMPI